MRSFTLIFPISIALTIGTIWALPALDASTTTSLFDKRYCTVLYCHQFVSCLHLIINYKPSWVVSLTRSLSHWLSSVFANTVLVTTYHNIEIFQARLWILARLIRWCWLKEVSIYDPLLLKKEKDIFKITFIRPVRPREGSESITNVV